MAASSWAPLWLFQGTLLATLLGYEDHPADITAIGGLSGCRCRVLRGARAVLWVPAGGGLTAQHPPEPHVWHALCSIMAWHGRQARSVV